MSQRKDGEPASRSGARQGPPRVHLNRALSKLGILSRSQATEAILAGRVRVNGRVVTDPGRPVNPDQARIEIDEAPTVSAQWRTLLFHKPRGVVTTRRDPEGRATIYDVMGEEARGLVPVGRLDRATTGLLLLTTDTELAGWITDPANAVSRLYVVTVRGKVTSDEIAQLQTGITSDEGDRLSATVVTLRKSSNRESHLTVELREGKNREIRRLFGAVGHEVTRLKRVKIGGLELGGLEPGQWRELRREDIRTGFPGAPV
jgi:23S rRNA pseudouridine2605 synthase